MVVVAGMGMDDMVVVYPLQTTTSRQCWKVELRGDGRECFASDRLYATLLLGSASTVVSRILIAVSTVDITYHRVPPLFYFFDSTPRSHIIFSFNKCESQTLVCVFVTSNYTCTLKARLVSGALFTGGF